jgi:hypothetical protein
MAGAPSPSSGRSLRDVPLHTLAVALFLIAIAAGCSGGGSTGVPVTPNQPGGPKGAALTRAHRGTGPDRSQYVTTVLGDDPVAFYRLNEQQGSTAYDSSGNGNNGSYGGTVDMGQPALLKSDDAATSVAFPIGQVSEGATWTNRAVTAECWIKPTSTDLQSLPRIIDNAWTDHDGDGFMVWISSGTVAFNTGWINVTAGRALTPNRVYYVTGTYDATTGVSLYLDGQIVANVPPNDGPSPEPQQGDGTTTYIGVLNSSQFGMTDYFQGDVSDCAVYDHALTPQQVANHYDVGARKHVEPRPLPSPKPSPTAPPPTPEPSPIQYDANKACIDGTVYANNQLPSGEGEFETNGLDRSWWGRERGNPIGGNQYSGFQTSWGRNQYDTYFGDSSDGLPGGHDPFYVGADGGAPGSPQGVRIEAIPMPSDLVGNPAVGGADYYSGVIDTPIDLQYGFFVARVRVPAPTPGISPAWWLLTNNGVPQGQHGPLAGEWDIQEMFGNDLGNGMNAGTILWNSGANQSQNWGGTYNWPSTEQTTPSSDYHDYGALIHPGGAHISKNDYGPGGPGYIYGPSGRGVTDYLDGVPLYGHTGGADVTGGVAWKEMMAMFQVASPGSWLGSPNPSDFPMYYWVQWIRVYQRTSQSC